MKTLYEIEFECPVCEKEDLPVEVTYETLAPRSANLPQLQYVVMAKCGHSFKVSEEEMTRAKEDGKWTINSIFKEPRMNS